MSVTSNFGKVLRTLEVITVIGGTLGLVFGAFLFLDQRHQHTTDAIATNLDIERKLNELDLKKDAEAKVYYENKLAEKGALDRAETLRLTQLDRAIESKTDKAQEIEAAIRDIKNNKE
jgi:hypothetical protein